MSTEAAYALLLGLGFALVDWALVHTPPGWLRPWKRRARWRPPGERGPIR